MSLDDKRANVDRLDAELVRLLNERTKAVLDIGELKGTAGEKPYAPAREKAVLDKVAALNRGPLPESALRAIYREIMSASMALQSRVRVSYLGPPSTYTHQAARARFGASVEYVACETIADVFESVLKDESDYGVVPVENSTEGGVTGTLDKLVDSPLKVVAEAFLPIAHSLMARCPREAITRLYSKAEVFGQCRRWLQTHMAGVDLVPVASTARAAEMAAHEDGAGALASELAAEIYGLPILARRVQDLAANMTRFFILGRACGEPTGDDKTSLLFSVKHEPGTLYGALEAFRRYGLNLTRIESRPSRTQAWEYYFFVDVTGHMRDEKVAAGLKELAGHCIFLTVLGSYPRGLEGEQRP